MLISIEGIDGAGKSTAIAAITQELPEAVVLREPGGTELSELMRSLLKGDDYNLQQVFQPHPAAIELLEEASANPQLLPLVEAIKSRTVLPQLTPDLSAEDELILFNVARVEIWEKKIKPLLKQGKTVLMDRFIDSTVAYQGYGRGLDPQQVYADCLQAVGGVEPDLTIYLRIDPETRLERITGRGKEDRIEASGSEFFSKVVAGFDAIQNYSRVVTVDGQQTPQQVAQEITAIINQL